MTRRLRRVALATGLGALLCWAGGAPARAEEPSTDPGADLRMAARESAPLPDRLAAARRLVAAGTVPDAERALRVAAMLLSADAETGGRLAKVALETAYVPSSTRTALAQVARAAAAGAAPAARQALAATRVLVGDRPPSDALAEPWPPSEFVLEVLRADAPELDVSAAHPLDAAAWGGHAEIAALLDAASEDDAGSSRASLDALRARGAKALPLLRATARAGARRTPEGLVPRRVRAIVALGLSGDAEATSVLLTCLDDTTQSGWVRVAAVDALGDLGDPSAASALTHVLFYLGDVHRPRDGWDYPGEGNTDVPVSEWNDVEYYAIDCAAANALLRLGVRDAAEWLLRERLDPRTGRWRIRVLQDATDAIRRAFPDAPRAYEPDAGLPLRERGYEALLAWWRAGPRLAHPVDEKDPRFAVAARSVCQAIAGKSVMELQTAKRAAALLGSAMTPYVLEALAATTRRVQRAELASVLGTLRDRRAIAPLLGLTKDAVPAVRSNAAEALAAYADPPDPALLSGAAEPTSDAIVARWIEMLSDADPGPRASAMKALTSLPPRDDVRAALLGHASATHPENAFGDFQLAECVVRLLQTGEGLDAVKAWLVDRDLFRRRFVWELLRAALRLEPTEFDPTPEPGTPKAKPLDPARLSEGLARRRGA